MLRKGFTCLDENKKKYISLLVVLKNTGMEINRKAKEHNNKDIEHKWKLYIDFIDFYIEFHR